ncbi:MAG TPA: hypothetical protein VGX37_05320 [Allosphingosinicella sp.]|nr:hypothetical protein [Allosphingosinicella sp.]
MPKWPAYLMGIFLIACAYPAITASAPAPVAEGYGAVAAAPAKAASPAPEGIVELASRAASRP